MLLRNRASNIDAVPASAVAGYEHVAASAIAVMRWLGSSGVDFVLVGAVARQARGDLAARGPVDIVPAPYGRNLDRLARALNSERLRQRSSQRSSQGSPGSGSGQAAKPMRLSSDLLVRSERWELSFGEHDLDIEGRPDGGPSYQALLYEAVRFSLFPERPIEVAAPEDIEYYDHLRRTGVAPTISVSRL